MVPFENLFFSLLFAMIPVMVIVFLCDTDWVSARYLLIACLIMDANIEHENINIHKHC